jgi:hypothetical protein
MNGVARCPTILIAGKMGARASAGRDEIRATLETCSDCPVTMTGAIASRHVKGQRADDPQTEPANSPPPGLANDHEDGGPTIQLPAAEARCTLRFLSCVQYTGLRPSARTTALQRCSRICLSSVRGRAFRCAPSCYSPPHVPVIDVHSFGLTYPGAPTAGRSRRRLLGRAG